MTMGSASRSLISTAFLFSSTSGCGVSTSQPTCENRNPRRASWGSAFVSLYLWCTLWSSAHWYTCRWEQSSDTAVLLHSSQLLASWPDLSPVVCFSCKFRSATRMLAAMVWPLYVAATLISMSANAPSLRASPKHSKYPAHFILLDYIILTLFSGKHKLWNSTLYNYSLRLTRIALALTA